MAHQPPQDKQRAAACFLCVIFAHTPSASELSTNLNTGSQGTFSRAVPAREQLAFSTTRCLQPPSPTPWEHKRCKEELFATEKFPDKEVAHGNMSCECTPSPKNFAVRAHNRTAHQRSTTHRNTLHLDLGFEPHTVSRMGVNQSESCTPLCFEKPLHYNKLCRFSVF